MLLPFDFIFHLRPLVLWAFPVVMYTRKYPGEIRNPLYLIEYERGGPCDRFSELIDSLYASLKEIVYGLGFWVKGLGLRT
jgi:hypothetical protein